MQNAAVKGYIWRQRLACCPHCEPKKELKKGSLKLVPGTRCGMDEGIEEVTIHVIECPIACDPQRTHNDVFLNEFLES